MIRCVFLGYMWQIAAAIRENPGYELVSVGIEPQRGLAHEIQSNCEEFNQKTIDARGIRKNSEFRALLKEGVDLLIVGAFGQILSPDILDNVRLGSINFHPSLLPNYRGGSPLEEQILCGETAGGMTAHWLTEEVDQGDIISAQEIIIGPDDNYLALYERTHKAAGELMAQLLKIKPQFWPRIETSIDTSIYRPRSASDGKIYWDQDAEKIHRLVRALGWRGWVRSSIGPDQYLVIEEALVVAGAPQYWMPGLILEAEPYPLIGTAKGLLRLTRFKLGAPLVKGSVLQFDSRGD
jgi:methionyl-tRNA formyltransferase